MREILFRGKRSNGKWAEGGIFIQKEDEVKDFAVYIVTPSLAAKCNMYEVHPATVGQYTGLKDKNGKRIFEGDIVHCVARLDCANCVVIFEEGEFRLVSDRYYKTYITGCGYRALRCFDKEVIGNIHDNPELMEVRDGK